nr:hypothetical protein [Nanoarchaeota archaeon]
SNIAWGSFFGLSDEFKRKYKLTIVDEIALLARYFQITSFAGRDYESAYKEVKYALGDITSSKWQQEVPSSLRILYAIKGTRAHIIYQPKNKEDSQRLRELFNRLSSYAFGSNLTTKDILDLDRLSSQEIKAFLISLILSEEDGAYYKNLPQTPSEQRAWLSRWYTLITDRLKLDYKPNLEQEIKKAVERRSLSIPFLEDRLINSGFKLLSISERKELFKVDNELKSLIKKGNYPELTDYFFKKWLPQIRCEDIEIEDKFTAWIDRGFDKFLNGVIRKTGKLRKEIKEQEIRDALFRARKQYIRNPGQILSLRKKQYAQSLLDKLLKLFSDEIISITEQLKKFEEETISSKDNLYVGVFDDLLHLAGEFMMTGVCTWPDRARQIKEGKNEGCHFATIALKDSSGRVLGFSQVQILKTPIKGRKAKFSQMYRTLSLTGINLSERKIPIDRKRALLVILKAAYELSRNAGLQPVIVYSDGIHSNQEGVKRCIKELADQGYLKKGKLLKTVQLSKNPSYTYQDVYIIESLPDIELTPTTIEEATASVQKEEYLLERKHLSFYNEFGYIIHNGELPEKQARKLGEKAEEILKSMPQNIIGDVRLNLSREDVAFNLVYEPSLEQSAI